MRFRKVPIISVLMEKRSARNTTANIDIVTKEDKDGIDIIIKPGTVNESVHIPVVLSESGLQGMCIQ